VKQLIKNLLLHSTWFVLALWAASTAALPEGFGAPQGALQPEGWDQGMKLPEARDLNPDPSVFEMDLEAKVAPVEIGNGQRVEAWTYNGGLPGPLIRLKVGDRLIVRFKNSLPEPTTVHWHGVRVPIAMDGVPGISQPDVQPGATFTYDFVVPDAGLYWYHPHVMSAMQVGFGLYGALLVDDPAETISVADELVIVLSDIGITGDGSLDSPESGGSAGMAFGREGNLLLVNGRRGSMLLARSGAPQRWRIVNTAKSRYFNLDIGEGNTFTKIGGDGGLQEYPTEWDFLVLAPGERADVIVMPRAKPGTDIVVISQRYDRGYGSIEYRQAEPLFRIQMANLPEHPKPALSEVRRAIEPLEMAGATEVQLDLSIIQKPEDNSFEYQINKQPYWRAKPIPARVGETQLWTVRNETPWSHPLHLHGFFFQVLDKEGRHARPIEWKDTVNVPYKDSLRLLVRYDDRPGQWMVHCHILDHAEGGLMTTVQLGDGPVHSHEKH
jgi:FtsP/CotA-like multicopper oxidase with cupredoxin domain